MLLLECKAAGFVAVDGKAEQVAFCDCRKIALMHVGVMLFAPFRGFSRLQHSSYLALTGIAAGTGAEEVPNLTVIVIGIGEGQSGSDCPYSLWVVISETKMPAPARRENTAFYSFEVPSPGFCRLSAAESTA